MSDSNLLSARKVKGALARRIGLIAMVGLLVAGSLASLDAEARRMGGGRSIGRQSNSLQQRQTPPPSQPAQSNQATQQRAQPAPATTPTPPAAPNRNRWLGPIAGLAAGLGIAALLSHFGLGEAFAGMFANVIVIALIAMAVIWLIRRFTGRKRDASQPAYAGTAPSLNAGNTGYAQEPRYSAPPAGSYLEPQGNPLATPSVGAAPSVPAGFDTEAFLRNAKVYFVRLQAAWDVGNVEDIREFTTPEMFAEVRVDLAARGTQANQTDVVQLNAELLDIEERATEYFASVRFSGLIREEPGAAAEPFVEVWNLSKAHRPGEGWLLAGIQQVEQH
ncbi:Tim44 domain-containing protein [Paraburkholderia sp. Ac-20336]|uniref:Tim44 domain-containing protein n=1 Tax=Burkholderiaceae TaxID=119060 RepID=UPI00142192E8|nr:MULTISPECIES: TIM44-like domain-containing protein [Burkholderiaceae]MBN3805657.1 Tim44 domain-containing protein [Paraburkholderia sp. Ac-20336]NIF50510.1 Tim44 domain-containing protein [Burkholderia sp. Ax-1724]NIF80429.1 Tim44 domain-containing protein [Paraburkholderia sp. Cy-641]